MPQGGLSSTGSGPLSPKWILGWMLCMADLRVMIKMILEAGMTALSEGAIDKIDTLQNHVGKGRNGGREMA